MKYSEDTTISDRAATTFSVVFMALWGVNAGLQGFYRESALCVLLLVCLYAFQSLFRVFSDQRDMHSRRLRAMGRRQ